MTLQINCSDDCNSFKSQLVFEYLKRFVARARLISIAQLPACEDHLVNEDDVLARLNELDHKRKDY